MSELKQLLPTLPVQPFRLDVPLHNLLQQTQPQRQKLQSSEGLKTLPEPVFPQHPELIHELDEADIAAHDHVLNTGKREWPASRIFKNMTGWMFPYFQVAAGARGFSADHRVSLHRVEMQPGLPLLLVVRQSREGHDGRRRAASD